MESLGHNELIKDHVLVDASIWFSSMHSDFDKMIGYQDRILRNRHQADKSHLYIWYGYFGIFSIPYPIKGFWQWEVWFWPNLGRAMLFVGSLDDH